MWEALNKIYCGFYKSPNPLSEITHLNILGTSNTHRFTLTGAALLTLHIHIYSNTFEALGIFKVWDYKVLPQKMDFSVLCKNIPTFIPGNTFYPQLWEAEVCECDNSSQPQELQIETAGVSTRLTLVFFIFGEISWFVPFKKSEFSFRQIWADIGWACLTHKQQISLYLTNQFTYNLCVCDTNIKVFHGPLQRVYRFNYCFCRSDQVEHTCWSECGIFRTVCTVSRFCCFTFTN